MNFKKFLEEEVAASKRKSILHLEKAKPSEFLELAREILNKNGGKLENIKISLKVDGAGIRFGKDSQGKFFFETSRSGPIWQRKAFSTYARQKDGSDIERAMHYDDIFDHLEASNLWKDLPSDTKVIAEILYNPMAEVINGDKIKFVTIEYDKSKLGSLMTIIPFDVVQSSTGFPHKDKEKILKNLLSKSTPEIKIASAELQSSQLDVSAILKPIQILGNDIDRILSSRKKEDKAAKELYQAVLQNVKEQLAKYILENPNIEGKDKFGPDFEGIVLDIGGRVFKITTQKYKHLKFG